MKVSISVSPTLAQYKVAAAKIDAKFDAKIKALTAQVKAITATNKKLMAALNKERAVAQAAVDAVDARIAELEKKSGLTKAKTSLESNTKARLNAIFALRNKHRMR